MIYDAFMYSGEIECLLIRLHELADVVDRFILVEGDRTFTGQLKDRLYYHGHDEQRIPPALRERIIPVYAVLPERAASPWDRETYQRNSILLGLGEARKDDVLLMGDVDEIPRASAVRDVVDQLGDKEQVAFDMTHAMYYVNNVCWTMRWRGTQAARVSWARTFEPEGYYHYAPVIGFDAETVTRHNPLGGTRETLSWRDWLYRYVGDVTVAEKES